MLRTFTDGVMASSSGLGFVSPTAACNTRTAACRHRLHSSMKICQCHNNPKWTHSPGGGSAGGSGDVGQCAQGPATAARTCRRRCRCLRRCIPC
jgi:hypothetical protein